MALASRAFMDMCALTLSSNPSPNPSPNPNPKPYPKPNPKPNPKPYPKPNPFMDMCALLVARVSWLGCHG